MHASTKYPPCFLAAAYLLLASFLLSPLTTNSAEKPNILFIAIDDLRPQTHANGHVIMHTPNMDRLAQDGRLFQRHYVQVPTCGASRYALLSGQYPKRSLSKDNGAFALYQQGHAPVSLPEWFRRHGYHTRQTGKISHSPDGFLEDRERIANNGTKNSYRNAPHLYYTNPDDPEVPGAWDAFNTPVGQWQTGWGAFFAYAGGKTRQSGISPALESAEVNDDGYPDGLMAEAAIATLAELRELDHPFFYALGFYKPHLPFNAPKKYWDLYDPAKIDLAAVQPVARRGGEFFGGYRITPDELDQDEAKLRQAIHGYYAAVSYVDAQVGKVLDTLDALDLADNTIVVLWGDHGYHLGELGYWGKHTLHEDALRSFFAIRAPGMPQPGAASDAIIGSVDIYPTLVELAGLPLPDHLDGQSFTQVLRDPGADPIGFALGFWKDQHSLRTKQHRLITDGIKHRLYQHKHDPGERRNVAQEETETVKKMQRQLQNLLDTRKAE